MPFYFRKSISAGPFRFNLSKSGLGVSAGVKGFRIGTGPRGHYIHAGRGGLYYRSSLGGGGGAARRPTSPASLPLQPTSPRTPPAYAEPNVQMVPVSSGDVLQMEHARFADVLADLTAKQNAMSMKVALGWAGVAVALFATLAGGAVGLIVGLAITGIAVFVGAHLDHSRRTSVLMYDLDEEAHAAYEAMTVAFDGLVACAGKWHVDAGGAVRDIHTWKRNAGAAHILDRRPTFFGYSLPRVIKSNITPPAIKSGKETLYFLPDFLLVAESNKVGAVAYDDLTIRSQDSAFIEDGTVPRDTQILRHTWKHPNKSGGPDRRFADNYQIPVCLYESIYLNSPNGLNELLQVSRSGVTQPFADRVKQLAKANGSGTVATVAALPAAASTGRTDVEREHGSEANALLETKGGGAAEDEAERIYRDRPSGWEYRLTLEILQSGMTPVLRQWDALKREPSSKPSVQRVGTETATWMLDRMSEIERLVDSFAALSNDEFARAWGAPGEPGDADAIVSASRRFTDVCGTALEWEEHVRSALVDPAFERVRALLVGVGGRLIDEAAKLPAFLSAILSDDQASGTHTLNMVLSLPEGWVENFSAALKHAAAGAMNNSELNASERGDVPSEFGGATETLHSTAYIIVDEAKCYYEADANSAVRFTPPYGTEVSVVLQEAAWVRVKVFGKEAWSRRENLSSTAPPARPTTRVPTVGHQFVSTLPRVEYGPRGGRFVRTASGFKRYL